MDGRMGCSLALARRVWQRARSLSLSLSLFHASPSPSVLTMLNSFEMKKRLLRSASQSVSSGPRASYGTLEKESIR